MGRKRKKIIKKRKPRIPTKYFTCLKCFKPKSLVLKLHKKELVVTAKCLCGYSEELPMRTVVKNGKIIPSAHKAIDYYGSLFDKRFEE